MSIASLVLISYLITLAVELPSGYLWKVRAKSDYVRLICINTITNPPLVLSSYYMSIHMPIGEARAFLYLMELLAVVIEAVMIGGLIKNVTHPVLFSIQSNICSFIAGIIISLYIL